MPQPSLAVRAARAGDRDAVAALAGELAMSFPFRRDAFEENFPALLAAPDASVLVAADSAGALVGYLLGFWHQTFYANGPVGWVEEILVRRDAQGQGAGRALMAAFERAAAAQGCALVALATRRAAPFYRALGYADSAVYFRKVLGDGS